MKFFSPMPTITCFSFRSEQVDPELSEEVRAYLERAIEEKVKQGMSRERAVRVVRLEQGIVQVTKEIVFACDILRGQAFALLSMCSRSGIASQVLLSSPVARGVRPAAK